MSSKSTTATAEYETVSTTSAKKMGLERFLQLKPQKSGIAAILRRRYASQVHTENEWESLLENVLNRKVR